MFRDMRAFVKTSFENAMIQNGRGIPAFIEHKPWRKVVIIGLICGTMWRHMFECVLYANKTKSNNAHREVCWSHYLFPEDHGKVFPWISLLAYPNRRGLGAFS